MGDTHTMGLREKVSGTYYTASEARTRLGLNDDTFQGWVRSDKLRKIILPGRKQGVYAKRDVDLLAARIEAAVLADQKPDIQFMKATPETQANEFELAVMNFGEKTSRFNEKRRELLQKNPDTIFLLYDAEFVVGSIDLVPLMPEAIPLFKNGERGWDLIDYVDQYTPGKPVEAVIIDMMTTTMAPANRQMQYAMHLLFGLADQLAEWGRKGIDITHVHACGGTPDGRRILKTAGFTFLGEPKPGRFMYSLEVSTSKLSILAPYRAALEEYKRKHGSQ